MCNSFVSYCPGKFHVASNGCYVGITKTRALEHYYKLITTHLHAACLNHTH